MKSGMARGARGGGRQATQAVAAALGTFVNTGGIAGLPTKVVGDGVKCYKA
jgi:hypothetical protein